MTVVDEHVARRAFWTERMEGAHTFMEAVLDQPVRECGEPVVALEAAVAAAAVRVVFSELPHAAGAPRRFWLRRSLVAPLMAVAADFNERGWVLRIEDAYRSPEMQRALACEEYVFDTVLRRVIWECGGERPSWEFAFRRLSALTATTVKTGTHIAATAVDVSVLRDTGEEVDRGGPYIELSELTPMDSPFIGGAAAKNRAEITAVMAAHGFVAYPFEFWHYNQGDAKAHILTGQTAPARYGAVDWNPQTNEVTP